MTEPRARVVWREDGRLVDAETATRPYRAPGWADAELQRVLDREARRLLAVQFDGDPLGAAAGLNGDLADAAADDAAAGVERPGLEDLGGVGDGLGADEVG